MAVTDYASLKTEIDYQLARSDVTTSDIENFILRAEQHLNRTLRHLDMKALVDVVYTADSSEVTLPTDFLETDTLYDEANTVKLYVKSYSQLIEDHLGEAGQPTYFSISGSNAYLAPTPSTSGTLKLMYYQKVPALSDSNTTNWLISNHSTVYLYGALTQAAIVLRDDAALSKWGSLFDRALAELENESFEGEWNGSPIAVSLDLEY